MTVIFAEYEALNEKVVNLLNQLSEYHDIVVFSCEREENRLAYEERLLELELGAESLLLRRDGDYTRSIALRLEFVVDWFNGDDEKAVEHSIVLCNNEPSVEMFRENGYFVLQTDWS